MKRTKQILATISLIMLTFFVGSVQAQVCTGDYIIDDIDTAGDIAALSGCTGIDGRLTIINTALTSLAGLESLQTVGDLRINANNALTSLSGLDTIETVDGYLYIVNNAGLTSLSGLDNINSVGGYLQINNNDDLTSLSGLDNINSVGSDLWIRNNAALVNLCALYDVVLDNRVTTTLEIYNNTLLSMATAEALETQLRDVNGFTGVSVIENNGGTGLVNCEVCVPETTVCSAEAECGVEIDECGDEIVCEDTCVEGESCNLDTNMCEVCVPVEECPIGIECGDIPDECPGDGTINCGTCDIGLECVDNKCEPELGEEGCTPGFWKNNAGLDYNYKNGKDKKEQDDNCWCGGYTADTLIGSVFVNATVPTTDTMIDAINYGGKGGPEYNLLRHAVAAVLNACSVDYPYTDTEIKSMVNGAIADPDDEEDGITAVHGKLVEANESEIEDTCIKGTCMKTGESCIDEPCKTYHNCPIDSNCNTKATLPEWILFTPFDVFMASENPVSCGGN